MKEKFKNVILWILGVFFILTGIIFINQILVPSILIIIAGILLLPPMNKMIKSKLSNSEKANNINNYNVIKNISIIIFFLIFMVNVPQDNTDQTTTSDVSSNTIIATSKEVNKEDIQINQNEIDNSVLQTITETNGTYTGERVDGKKQGTGKYEWKDGTRYEGEFSNNEINGHGKLTIPEKGTYDGNFVNGKKSGQGTYTFANGDVYVGNWQDDKMSGEGTYTFKNGDTYVGAFTDNKFNGKGTYTKNGNKYTGTWENNKYKK